MPASDAAEQRLRELGGTVERELPIVGGFSATLPASALRDLARSEAIGVVWGDDRIGAQSADTSSYDSWDPNAYWRKAIRLSQVDPTYSGTGVTVAVLDTGVSQVTDLGNRVLARVDLTPDHDGEDYFGHGTHLAGIVAGSGVESDGRWKGVAPRARIVSVKVAGADGSTDVSVVIAGLQWVASHRSDYNIRVLNLAFGTDGQQTYSLDPLNYAVEQVWFSGVMVVVSAGNRGSDAGAINKPGDDPFVLTVGAVDVKGTAERDDDVVAPFSSRGLTPDGFRKPNIVAPGITIVSARVPGSTIDQLHPSARVGDVVLQGFGNLAGDGDRLGRRRPHVPGGPLAHPGRREDRADRDGRQVHVPRRRIGFGSGGRRRSGERRPRREVPVRVGERWVRALDRPRLDRGQPRDPARVRRPRR